MKNTTPAYDVRATVYIVDDDISVREALHGLVAEAGWHPQVFATAQEFLNHPHEPGPSCLVLDLRLPDVHGLELQERIRRDRKDVPIIFITGHGDIPKTVQAMKAGAVEFLTKPFGPDILLEAIRSAIARSQHTLAAEAELTAVQKLHASLTARERDVMALVTQGLLNKQVAAELGISEMTVKAHRGHMMRKMQAKSLAELVQIAARLGLPTGDR